MEEMLPDISQSTFLITIVVAAIIIFLFIWKKEAHPDKKSIFRPLTRQAWKVVLLLALIVIILILIFDSPE